ncbi:MAG TPA: hypothetical protein VF765_04490 [Polyangiaceae bacterium]
MFIIIPRIRIQPRPRAAPAPAPPPPPQFALTPTTQNGETALFQDSRIGFSHALPGWPQATWVPPSPGEPPADAMVQFWDFPMWIRYRVETMTSHAPSAMHVAVDYAQRYATYRTRDPVKAAPARDDHMHTWSVDAAAVASYALVAPDPMGATHEDLAVLVKHATVLTVTRRHAGSAEDWVRHAAFRAAADATMLWDPARFRYDARIWPTSTFLEPMLPPVLLQGRQNALPGIAAAMQLAPGEGDALGRVLEAMMKSDDPPWAPLAPDARLHWAKDLASAVKTEGVAALLRNGLAEVVTSHDLRGFALTTGMALSGGVA